MALPYPTKVVLPFDIATAQDMNERHANDVALAAGTGLDDEAVTAVKTSFGGNYATSEVDTGFTWVDGKTIYKKTISFGVLPNNTTKNVAHGVTGLDAIINLAGYSQNASGIRLPVPFPATVLNQVHQFYADNTNIVCITAGDRTAYTTTYVTIHYTKT